MVYLPKSAYLDTPSGWDTCWKTAKSAAAAGTGTANVAFLGESTMNAPSGASGNFVDGFPARIRTALLQRYPLYADTFTPGWSSFEGAVMGAFPFPFTAVGQDNGSGGANSPSIFLGLGFVFTWTGAAAGNLTLNTVEAAPDFDIICDGTTAGTWSMNVDSAASGTAFTYTVDGGSVLNGTTGTPVTITGPGSPRLYRITIRGLGTTTHTVACTNQSATKAMVITAISSYPNGASAKGLGFVFNQKGGYTSLTYVNNTNSTALPVAANWAGKTASAKTGFGYPAQPHLAVIMYGINDANAVTPWQHYTILHDLITSLRNGRPGCSVMLASYPYPDTYWSDITTSFGTHSDVYKEYTRAHGQIARDLNCAWFNLAAKWPIALLAGGFATSASNPHPNLAGVTDIANSIIPYL